MSLVHQLICNFASPSLVRPGLVTRLPLPHRIQAPSCSPVCESTISPFISLTLSGLFAAGSRSVTKGCCNVPAEFAEWPAYRSSCANGVVKPRTFGPLTLLGISVVDSNFRPPGNASIAPVSFPVRYSFDDLASNEPRSDTTPSSHWFGIGLWSYRPCVPDRVACR